MNTEFGLHRIELTGANQASLSGRVFAGIVRYGICFTQACEIQYISHGKKPLRLPVAKISLVVRQIICYGWEISELDEGLTGLVEVTGSGISLITPGMSLIAISPTLDSEWSGP